MDDDGLRARVMTTLDSEWIPAASLMYALRDCLHISRTSGGQSHCVWSCTFDQNAGLVKFAGSGDVNSFHVPSNGNRGVVQFAMLAEVLSAIVSREYKGYAVCGILKFSQQDIIFYGDTVQIALSLKRGERGSHKRMAVSVAINRDESVIVDGGVLVLVDQSIALGVGGGG